MGFLQSVRPASVIRGEHCLRMKNQNVIKPTAHASHDISTGALDSVKTLNAPDFAKIKLC
jgi:hypothetical protein